MSFLIPSLNRFLINASLGICLLVTACGATPVNVSVLSSQVTCIPPIPTANPYLNHILSPDVAITYSNRLANPVAAKQEALSQLGKNTQHWSDQINVATDDAHMVRIMITYLDPVLIQYIVLNNILNDPLNSLDPTNFNNALNTTMQKLSNRNELLFVVTILSPFYNEQAYNGTVLTVRLPIEQLELVSASDVRATPVHEDHILDENMDITHGPISGIVGYPLAVLNQSQCIAVADDYTTMLTLDVPSITLGSNPPSVARFWHIPYQALVMENNNHPTPTHDPYYDSNAVTPLSTPPTPNWKPNAQSDDTDWTTYWNDMGRYIWNIVIAESHH